MPKGPSRTGIIVDSTEESELTIIPSFPNKESNSTAISLFSLAESESTTIPFIPALFFLLQNMKRNGHQNNINSKNLNTLVIRTCLTFFWNSFGVPY